MRSGLRAWGIVALSGAMLLFSPRRLPAQDPQMSHGNMSHDSMMTQEMSHDSMMPMALQGTFGGANSHTVSGSYTIVANAGGQAVQLGADFSLDNAPDPYVVLSPSGKGADPEALNLGVLRKLKGMQLYAIPSGTDLSKYTQVLIWCKKFNVTLGSAHLASHGDMMHQ